MALIFNMPPNWPQKPRGWKPEPGWQPDPEWGPAPEKWQFWREESNLPAENSEPAATADSHPETAAEVHDDVTPAAAQEEKVAPLADREEEVAPAAAASAAPATSAAAASAEPTEPAKASVAAEGEKPRRRTGLLLGTGAALLALLAGGILLGHHEEETTNASQDSTSAAASSTLETSSATALQSTVAASSSPSASVVPGTPKELKGEYNGYSGKGLEVFDMIIPGGAGAYYTYTFKGNDENSKFSLQGMDLMDKPNEYSRTYQGKNLKGAGLFDVVPGGTRTFKIKADGDGEWNIKLFPLSSTPTYEKGETASGDSPSAFFYEGDSSKLDVRFVPDEGSKKSSFSLQSGVDDDPLVKPALETKKPTVKTIKVKGGKTLFLVSATDGKWSVTFK